MTRYRRLRTLPLDNVCACMGIARCAEGMPAPLRMRRHTAIIIV